MAKQKPNGGIDPDLFAPDQNRLDEEWVEQPRLYFKYAKKLADAKRDVEVAKAELELVRAEISLEIRRKNERLEKKMTEAGIAAKINSHLKVERAAEALVVAKHTVDILTAATVALDHRKKALESLVWLHSQSYFSEPRPPEGADKGMADAVKVSVRNKVKGRIKK